MKSKTIQKVSLMMVTLLFSVCGNASAKYKRAMIFQGGGFQTAYFLGMFDGAQSVGMAPDVVLSTCGGSLAAALLNASDAPETRLEIVKSKSFYEILKSVRFTKNQWLPLALKLTGEIRMASKEHKIPNFFDHYLMKIPQDLGVSDIAKPFGFSQTHVVMVAAKTLFDRDQVGFRINSLNKIYQEVFFTDIETAPKLANLKSAVAELYSGSYVTSETSVVVDINALSAARASISDPFYMPPTEINGDHYITGSIDLYPLEVAKILADEVISGIGGPFDSMVEQPTIKSVFGYDHNARLKYIDDQYADYWIDMSDEAKVFSSLGFNPKLNILKFKIAQRVPKSYEEYVQRVQKLWQLGYDRSVEALSQKIKNDKCHIRFLNKGNSSKGLRQSLKQCKSS